MITYHIKVRAMPYSFSNVLYFLIVECATGAYGPLCSKQCRCEDNALCDKVTGFCPEGCSKGWNGPQCSQRM